MIELYGMSEQVFIFKGDVGGFYTASGCLSAKPAIKSAEFD